MSEINDPASDVKAKIRRNEPLLQTAMNQNWRKAQNINRPRSLKFLMIPWRARRRNRRAKYRLNASTPRSNAEANSSNSVRDASGTTKPAAVATGVWDSSHPASACPNCAPACRRAARPSQSYMR
jgi:hypothetical protein